MEERRVNPDCVNASNPFHVCADYCVRRAYASKPRSPRPKLGQNGEKRKEERMIKVAERNVDPSCPNASNPFHQCAEYCSPRNPDVKEQNAGKLSGISVKNLRIEDKQKRKEEETEHSEDAQLDVTAQNVETPNNEVQVTAVAKRNVDPSCPNATNPFHECAEYCSPGKSNIKRQNKKSPVAAAQNVERKKEDRGIIVAKRNVDPSCPNSSNPFHQCAEYCSPKKIEVAREKEVKRSVKNDVNMEGSRMVDPRCVNASNPYHVCAEYCFSKFEELEHAEAGKPESRGALKTMEREGVDPNCVNASNPFHKCAEYCFQKMDHLT